ncbi:hypothetical protein C0J52_27406, partial [Blattella germanica]
MSITERGYHAEHDAEDAAHDGLGDDDEDGAELADEALEHHQGGGDLDDATAADAGDSDGAHVLAEGVGAVAAAPERRQDGAEPLGGDAAVEGVHGRGRRPTHARRRRVVADGLDGAGQHACQHAQHTRRAHGGHAPLPREGHPEPGRVVQDAQLGVGAGRVALGQSPAEGQGPADAPHERHGEQHREQPEDAAPGDETASGALAVARDGHSHAVQALREDGERQDGAGGDAPVPGRGGSGVLEEREPHEGHGGHDGQRRDVAHQHPHEPEAAQEHLQHSGHGDGPRQLAHPDLPQLGPVLGRHGLHLLLRGTAPLRQTQDGQRRHQEGDGAPLHQGQAAAQGALEPRDQPRHQHHGADDVRPSRVVLSHAERRRQDERDANDGPDHRQVVLQCQKQAQVPRRGVVYAVRHLTTTTTTGYPLLVFFFFDFLRRGAHHLPKANFLIGMCLNGTKSR